MASNSAGVWPRASGWALGVLVLIQLGLGFYLRSVYTPTPESAHASVETLRNDSGRSLIQDFHYFGSAWLIVHGFIHIACLILSGTYLKIPKAAWFGTLLVLGSAFLAQVTGTLLPFDRHDVQTAVIEGGIASRMPLVGELAADQVLAGKQFGPQTLAAWNNVHFWLLLPLALGAALCLFGFGKGDSRSKSPVRFLWALPILGVFALSALLAAPHGAGATAADYAQYDARPSWYVWPMHGTLNMFDSLSEGLGWIGAGLLPALLGGLLLIAPWIGTKRDKWVRALFLLVVLVFAGGAIWKGGTPAPAWGLQEVDSGSADDNRADAPVDEAKTAAGLELAKKKCSPCHGADLKGSRSPDLTMVYLKNRSKKWYVDFLKDPKAIKPGIQGMPSFKELSDEQLEQLAEWLRARK